MLKKLSNYLWRHKIVTLIIIALVAGGGFYAYGKITATSAANKYVVSTVSKGTVISTIAGSGQVSTSDSIDIKPKVSGDIISIGAKANQEVKKDDVIAVLNSKDQQKNVRDAQISLESAQLSLQKLQEATSATSLMQAQNSLQTAKDSLEKLKITQQTNLENAQEAKTNADTNLKKAYDDGFNSVANTFLDLPNIMAGLQDILYGYTFSSNQTNLDYYTDAVKSYDSATDIYKNDAANKYQKARTSYDKNFSDYKSASRYSDTTTIDLLITESYETTKSIADAIKSANNFLQFYEDKLTQRNLKWSTITDTQLSKLGSYTGTTNSHLGSLLSATNTISNDKQNIITTQRDLDSVIKNNPLDIASAELSIKEKEATLADLQSGPDSLDLRAQQISIQQRQIALSDAQEKLADYVVRSPADGIIASVTGKVGDSASTGTAIASLISKQKIANVSLGETDITKIKIGQKATFTFDAIDGLTLTGEVAEVGSVGATSNGVVSYTVKIVFNTDDDRVKSGMSFSVNIITDSKIDVITVPSSAVKANASGSYVEMPDETISDDQVSVTAGIVLKNKTKQQTVEIGLSDGTNTEITSGLLEGDKIVTKTIKPSTTTAKSSTTGSLSSTRSSAGSTTKSTTQSLLGGTGAIGGPPRD
ncbi:MAG TPA: efflux RND transporter periplasmic adaptor subunit [Patescibacteria group bacterium]|nr:efflux RND transporter periplasmic adaptor subunit [Patescibacteria group bacterium]